MKVELNGTKLELEHNDRFAIDSSLADEDYQYPHGRIIISHNYEDIQISVYGEEDFVKNVNLKKVISKKKDG